MFAKIQKNPENPENVESGSKIRIRIPENFWPQIFLKFDFKGGLWSKICHKNDFFIGQITVFNGFDLELATTFKLGMSHVKAISLS